ncbi:MAG: hypothetical protein DME26_12710 [Verrucomicrobia bacterium]|nr:MAG: hypothetical protein DME26_12710 [Verrucomicrobiota bacterium]
MKKSDKRNSTTFTPRKYSIRFQTFARKSARAAGHPLAFGIALLTIVIWALTGPIFGFSDTWQLVINTATTIVTFLMVFLIQNTQNRDCEAIQLKLDELVRAIEGSHNALLDIEELSEEELDGELAREAREALRSGKSDLGAPEVNENERPRAENHKLAATKK